MASAMLFWVLISRLVTTPVAITRISAWRKTLSLNAPRNWVRKKGRKRRVFSSGIRVAFIAS